MSIFQSMGLSIFSQTDDSVSVIICDPPDHLMSNLLNMLILSNVMGEEGGSTSSDFLEKVIRVSQGQHIHQEMDIESQKRQNSIINAVETFELDNDKIKSELIDIDSTQNTIIRSEPHYHDLTNFVEFKSECSQIESTREDNIESEHNYHSLVPTDNKHDNDSNVTVVQTESIVLNDTLHDELNPRETIQIFVDDFGSNGSNTVLEEDSEVCDFKEEFVLDHTKPKLPLSYSIDTIEDPNEVDIDEYIKKINKKEKEYCEQFIYDVKQTKLKNYVKQAKSINISCKDCGRMLRSVKEEDIHKDICPKQRSNVFRQTCCGNCGASFNIILGHTCKISKERKRDYNYQCDDCDSKFKIKKKYAKHIKCHSKERSSYSCEKCGNKFLKQTSLEKHLEKHSNTNKFVCDQCANQFRRMSTLVDHKKTHGDERPFPCSWKGCEKRFKKLIYASTHLRIHTGEKPFKCANCNKSFRKSTHRNIHRLIHTGEANYSCHQCGKKFVQKCNLTVHEKKCVQQY